MSCRRVISRNEILFRILKTKGSEASAICEKMKMNIRNITILSEDELCELWHHVKLILLDAQKLSILQSDNEHSKEHQQALKLIHTIAVMAFETVLQRAFVPNVLFEIIIILHSVILPEIKNEKVKDEISYLLEHWWKLNMIWKEKVILNVIKHLIEKSTTSLQHIKRLCEIKSALYLMKRKEDIQTLVELSQNIMFMSIQEGRDVLLHLFTLGQKFITGIHSNVKAILEIAESNIIKAYADLYAKAWLGATRKNKKLINTICLENIVFHCLRSQRNSAERVKLGKNLLTFVDALHHNKDIRVKKGLHNFYETLLRDHLKAHGSCVRCNAAEILFIIYPLQSKHNTRSKSGMNLNEQHIAISHLLKDSSQEVCHIAISGTLKILETYWNRVPIVTIQNWLNILLCHMKSECPSEVKINILNGVKQIISNKNSHTSLKNFLSNFADHIYDADIEIIKTFTKLLIYLQNNIGISVWDIVTLTTLLKFTEDTDEVKVIKQLVKLLCLRIQPRDLKNNNIAQEIVKMGTKNVVATRKFLFHSKHVISWDNALKLITTILVTIEKQAKCLVMDKEENNKCNKRFKRDNNRSHNANSIQDMDAEEINVYESISILLDAVAILLYVNKKSFTKEYFDKQEKDLQQIITKVLPQCLCFYSIQKMALNESIIFLLSFVPLKLLPNATNIYNTTVEQLFSSNISDDTLITILYTLIKWKKLDTIFVSLKESMIKFTNGNMQHNEEFNNCSGINENQKILTLCIRILKYLLVLNSQEEFLKEYCQDFSEIFENLRVIQDLIENRLNYQNNTIDEEMLTDLFREYTSIISILLKNDIFDITEHLQNTLLWIKEKVVSKMPVMEEYERHQFPVTVLNIIFEACNSMIKQCQLSPEMCCKIIMLYFKVISIPSGIIFINNALKAINVLLDFSKIKCDNKDSNLLNIILPKFLSAIMTTTAKYSKDIITAHTNNLNLLPSLIHKYFYTIECTYNDLKMHNVYLTVLLNAAINCISKEIINASKDSSIDVLKIEFPYLTETILKFTLYVKKYQDACFFTIKQTLKDYNEVDMLSTLLIINNMFKFPVKVIKLEEVTHAIKLEYETRFNFITYNGFITDSIKKMTTLIQNHS